MQRIAIFASGTGTNTVRIIEYFKGHSSIGVSLVLSNKADAPVLEKAKNLGVESVAFNRGEFYDTNDVVDKLQAANIDFVVLAGFLWKVPDNLLKAFPDRIINIHPALLPKFGGKGMYGMNVHRAVKESGEAETGISIHLVNEEYDKGRMLFQARCKVLESDTPESIAAKVHELEYTNFPREIELFVKSNEIA
ncbi:MAG: phosphoribosylglycinamide formyltransferase [Flavobacteriales bacterium]|nr:phosphoribosylglycinamide formyltransferase [Flavobacteriales bacterium]MCB9205658.1 phosphoribosylglycinamide formyltransferase [Flavobacteriales bacterium]